MIAVATFQQGNSNNYAFPVSELEHNFLSVFSPSPPTPSSVDVALLWFPELIEFLSDAMQEYKFNNIMRIDWPSGSIPSDEPQCGFLNEHCTKDDGHVMSMVVAGVLGLILFCSVVITISIYRKWKIELEIEGLLWKIEPHEIKGFFNNDIVSSPSKVCRQTPSHHPLKYNFIPNFLSCISSVSSRPRVMDRAVQTKCGQLPGAFVAS